MNGQTEIEIDAAADPDHVTDAEASRLGDLLVERSRRIPRPPRGLLRRAVARCVWNARVHYRAVGRAEWP